MIRSLFLCLALTVIAAGADSSAQMRSSVMNRTVSQTLPKTVKIVGSGGFRGLEAYQSGFCLLYTSPSPRDGLLSRMPSSA